MLATDTRSALGMAAVVYDDCVSIDALLLEFASELKQAGVRLGGVVQLPHDAEVCGPSALMRVQDLDSGDVIQICQNLGPGSQSCSLDSSALAAASVLIHRAIDEEKELIFISRFGRQEAGGRGFRAELGYAFANRRPVLTAVRRGLVDNWFYFTGGVGTVLDCRLWVLRNWWSEVAKRPSH